MNRAPLNIVLHENQQKIHEGQALYKVVKAGKRFGKTKWALFEICQAAGKKPNGTFWLIAPTYRQGKNIAWQELNWILPKQYIRRSVENELMKELVNGSIIKIIGADNEDALRGTKLDGAVFDECAYIDSYVWEGIVHGQLLGSKTEAPGFAYFISSPNKTGRNWFSNFYDEALRKQKVDDKDWSAHFYTIYDNPTLNKEEVEKMKADIPDDTWNLEYMAQESDFAGQKYSEFKPESHVSPSLYKEEWGAYRAIDWGLDHPTVVLWARVSVAEQCIYIHDEFVKSFS